MNIETAKQIAITDYLASQGINPIKVSHNQTWYLSPLREEKEPSFKVNNDNQWIDFGTGEKGDIINLVMKLHKVSTTTEALQILSNNTIIKATVKSPMQLSSAEIANITVNELHHPQLLKYLSARKIPRFEFHKIKENYFLLWITN